jgi:putative N-acetyltransferase (TIGR04045 family)
MLSSTHGWEGPPEPYLSHWIVAEPARDRWQLAAYYALRRAVFVREQRMFAETDVDEHDPHALHLVAMAPQAGVLHEVVGVVRIYEQDGVWFGGRLAVVPQYRRCREVGSALTREAVGAARALGASRFLATVQQDNVRFFERQHFVTRESLSLCGRAHQLMEADLGAFAIPAWARQLARSAA